MSFFTDELMKCTDEFEGRKCIGNAMYIPLGENNRLKIFFTTLGYRMPPCTMCHLLTLAQ